MRMHSWPRIRGVRQTYVEDDILSTASCTCQRPQKDRDRRRSVRKRSVWHNDTREDEGLKKAVEAELLMKMIGNGGEFRQLYTDLGSSAPSSHDSICISMSDSVVTGRGSERRSANLETRVRVGHL